MSMWEYANPRRFMGWTRPVLPWTFGAGGGVPECRVDLGVLLYP